MSIGATRADGKTSDTLIAQQGGNEMRLACIVISFFLYFSTASLSFAGQAGTAPVVEETSEIAIQRWMNCLGQAAINGPITTHDADIADRSFRFCHVSELEMDRALTAAYKDKEHAQRAKDELVTFKAGVRSELLKEIVKIRSNQSRTVAAQNAHRRWVNCFQDKTRDSTTPVQTTSESGFSACSVEQAGFAALVSDDPTERAKVVNEVRHELHRALVELHSGW